MTKYRGASYTWSNLGGETGSKIDVYSASLSEAISIKSAQSFSNINAISYFNQIYRGGIRDGVRVNGVLTRFDKLKIDVVIPEGATQADILNKVNSSYTKIEDRTQRNPHLYPELVGQDLRSYLKFEIGLGYD